MRREARMGGGMMTNYTNSAEWRSFPGTDGKYQISDGCGVRNARTFHHIKGAIKSGALYFPLTIGEKLVYFKADKACWEAFNGPIPEDKAVIHTDGNKLNCRLKNLELGPKKEKKMKLTREDFAAGLEAARNRETPEQPGSIAAEIARDLKHEKLIKETVVNEKAAEIPENIVLVEKPEPPLEKPHHCSKYATPEWNKAKETVIQPKLHGTIHGPLDQVVKMLKAADLGNASVVITFEE